MKLDFYGDRAEFTGETRTIVFGLSELNFIYREMRKAGFRAFLNETIDATIEDNEIDLSRYDGTREDFADEILSCLENLEDIESATEQQIADAVIDTAQFYNLFT